MHVNPIQISFMTSTGRVYTLQTATTLLADTWQNVPENNNLPGTGNLMTVTSVGLNISNTFG